MGVRGDKMGETKGKKSDKSGRERVHVEERREEEEPVNHKREVFHVMRVGRGEGGG